MSKEERDLYRTDQIAYELFIEEEKQLIADPVLGFKYFINNYAVHSPVSGGGAEALSLFKFQSSIGNNITVGDHIFLKPRRMGVTLIVGCLYPVWVTTLKEGGEASDVKIVSKGQTEADEIIANCKMIINSLPDYLHVPYGMKDKDNRSIFGKENNSHITFPGREHSSIRALTSSGARSFKATILIIDEQAWQQNADETWTASMYTTEGGGQTILISTGNGKTGKGKVFHDLYWKAKKDKFMITHFFPWWFREDRTQEWYEEQKQKSSTLEKLKQELPATEEECFLGYSEGSAYAASQLIKARELGEIYDKSIGTDQQIVPEVEGISVGIDWGINSAAAIIVPLSGFGFWQIDELTTNKDDAETFSKKIIERAKYWADILGVDFNRAFYDAAGAQQMKSFARISQGQNIQITKIPFSKYKLSTIQFTKLLLKRTYEGEEICYFAISPRCDTTITQMTDIKHKQSGDFEKGNDHNLDSLIAGLAYAGTKWDKYNRA